MADEKVIGGGVGGDNTGNSGINDGNLASGGNGGGGSGSTSTGLNTSSTSGTAGTGSTSGTAGTGSTSGTAGTGSTSGTSTTDDFSQKEQEVDDILSKWMANFAIGLTFEQVVDLYLENKLGFGPNGETLKKKYKEDNPDMDPDEIDKEVDQQLEASKEEFTTTGSAAKEELQAKYNEFKSSSFEALGNLKNMVGEFAKTIANAYMPTSIGPVAPNPLSVALKLYVGLTALKKLIDRVVISMTVLMAAARSIGADNSPVYTDFISAIHSALGPMMKSIKDKEEEGDNLKNLDKAEFLLAAKERYTATSLVSGNIVSAKELEEMARSEFNIYIWPLENKDLNKLYNIIDVNPVVGAIPGLGVIAAIVDISTTNNRERRAQMLVDYNKFLKIEEYQWEQDWKLQLESENNNG